MGGAQAHGDSPETERRWHGARLPAWHGRQGGKPRYRAATGLSLFCIGLGFVSVYPVWFQSVKLLRAGGGESPWILALQWGIPVLHPIPSSRQMASTRFLTLDGMVMGVPHSRVVSPGHLLVASMPIFEPRPLTGEAKSR